MFLRRAIRRFLRPYRAPVWRPGLPRSPRHPRQRPEFQRVNALAGMEPVRPELSGLRLRRAGVPRRVTRSLIQLAYRWHPSREYRRRQHEMRRMNQRLRRSSGDVPVPPPILSYTERTNVTPVRVQPMLDPGTKEGPLRELPPDPVERQRPSRIIRPRPSAPEPEPLLSYRPLLPRHYRQFLRYSPYPRLAAAIVAVTVAVSGVLWVGRLQQAEAVAAGQARVVRHSFERQLLAARSFGLDARIVTRLSKRAHALYGAQKPDGLIVSRTQVAFYWRQERGYASLLHDLRALERQALRYWAWKEWATHQSLLAATQATNALGLTQTPSSATACATAACYQQAVRGQLARVVRLRHTVATLRAYGEVIARAADPASAADAEVQEVHNLAGITPVTPPVAGAHLDELYAAASGAPGYARVGALAHLDRDVLEAAVVRGLPARAIMVSTERGILTCYRDGKAVFRTAISARAATPTGVFHLQDKEAAAPAMYWHQSGSHLRYRYGTLPDWMPFSGGTALQGAPWRLGFGPNSEYDVGTYAPSTPASIDLPPAAAARVFGWARVGTEVVVE